MNIALPQVGRFPSTMRMAFLRLALCVDQNVLVCSRSPNHQQSASGRMREVTRGLFGSSKSKSEKNEISPKAYPEEMEVIRASYANMSSALSPRGFSSISVTSDFSYQLPADSLSK
jgi:hypothetical protein